jgi:hypothetical protein
MNEEYYPYGGTSHQALRRQTETPKRRRYAGKERDEETGLYYYVLRGALLCPLAGKVDELPPGWPRRWPAAARPRSSAILRAAGC